MAETIEVRYKPQGAGIYHQYIVYTNSLGQEFAIRGGPTSNLQAGLTGALLAAPYVPGAAPLGLGFALSGNLVGSVAAFNEEHPDFPSPGTSHYSEFIATDADLSGEFAAMSGAVGNVNDSHFLYLGAGQNSNSFVKHILQAAGLSTPQDDDFGEYYSPGAEDNLFFSNQFLFTGISAIADLVKQFIAWAKAKISPLVLDLDGDGVELTALAYQDAIKFDHNGDGFSEATGWVEADDGLLAIDLNSDGMITGSELFGDQTGSRNGFSVLADYDTNGDGKITSEDQDWQNLRVWIDSNQDGQSQGTELQTLDELLITQISTGYSDVNYDINGNTVEQEGTFVINGNTRDIVDAYFATDTMNSSYSQEYEFDLDILNLMTIRGYGLLPDLHIAMSLDNTGSGDLLELVEGFSILAIEDIFGETSDAMDDVRAIMYRWADVEGVSPTGRGPNVDGQELAFLEKMSGQPFLQRGAYSDPAPQAGYDLQQAFSIAHNHFFAKLAAQSDAGELFTGDFFYNIAIDGFEGIAGLDLTVLGTLETEATGLANNTERTIFWQNVLRMVEYTIGTTNLSGGDLSALETAIDDSGLTSLDVDDLVGSLVATHVVNGQTGTGGDDLISGTSGDDEISAQGGHDIVNAGAGNDVVTGDTSTGYADTITGGTGDDLLMGGNGNDIYHYTSGDGLDTINEQSGTDKIVLATGLDAGDLTFSRASNSLDMIVTIDDGVNEGEILIEDQFFDTDSGIETIEFAGGGGPITLANIAYTLTGTSGNDALFGVRYGGSENDVIYGGAGHDDIDAHEGTNIVYGEDGDDYITGGTGADTISGGNGNDVIDGENGTNSLTGGAGDDTVTGGTGNDTYYFTSGHDIYYEASGTDAIYLPAGFTSGATLYYRIGTDLKIVLDASNSITIDDFYGSAGKKIETLYFDGGTSINLTTVSATTQGDDNANTLNGGSGADILYGMGGNDRLDGNAGNDTLYGGNGNDTLIGDGGDDWLEGGAGDDFAYGYANNDHYFYTSGADTYEESGATDIVELAAGFTAGDLTFGRYMADLDALVINLGGANSITLNRQFWDTTTAFDTLKFSDTSTISLTGKEYVTHGTSGNDNIWGITEGGSINETIYGYAGNDTIDGENGNDYIDGGDGNDTLTGYTGNDTYVYSGGLDMIYDQSFGTEKLIMTNGIDINAISTGVSGSNGVITVNGGTDVLTIYLQNYSNNGYQVETVQFDDGFITTLSDHLTWTWGTGSVDTLTGSSGNNTIIGKAGNDTLDGAGGADAIHGGADNDTIYGGAASDLLHGGVGDDILYGGDGADTMFGGADEDIFMFEAATAYNNIDIVKDFTTGDDDAIDISDLLSAYDPMSEILTDFVQIATSSNDSTLSIDRDGTGVTYGWTQVALIQGVTGLTDEAALVTAGNLIVT